VLTDDGGLSMIHRRYKAASLREVGVIVSRPARLVGLLLSSHTPPSKSGYSCEPGLDGLRGLGSDGVGGGWRIGL
jgi:hypothetical protein